MGRIKLESQDKATNQVMDDPQQILTSRFGLKSFHHGQLEVINRLLAGRSAAAAVFPTGGGKSLCYQLPSQMFAGTTVVVSPLLALIERSMRCTRQARHHCVTIRLNAFVSDVGRIMRSLRSGECKLLYVALNVFSMNGFALRSRTSRSICLLVDEAHCISRWGHNFRPDYLKLAEIARELGAGASPCVDCDRHSRCVDRHLRHLWN